MNFAEKLKMLRKQTKMSQERLAEKIGVSRQAVTKWETDMGLPDIENMMAIASLFNISMDDLLSAEKLNFTVSDFSYESVTEYDIDANKHYDIQVGGAHEIVIESTGSEKLYMRLASNTLSGLQESIKVKIDDQKSRLDINVIKADKISESNAKEALSVFIEVPEKFLTNMEITAATEALAMRNIKVDNFEFDGKVDRVVLSGVEGHVELNSRADMDIMCDGLNGRIDINQISAASVIHLPKETSFFVKKKGKSNSLFYTMDGKPCDSFSDKDAYSFIELRGINTELIIDCYTPDGKEV